MADIFISYSQNDRSTAQDLAEFLERCGYDVWWDYDLVGGVTFREQIKRQLAAARAAIVIWSPTSVESNWVRDEAEEAMYLKKLLPTRTVELDFKSIPLGFRQLQTDPIDKPDRILRALEEFGVKPSNPPAQPTHAPVQIGGQSVDPETLAKAQQYASWEFIKDSKAPADFRSFIERFPASPFTELARGRLGTLADEAWRQLQAQGSSGGASSIAAIDRTHVTALQRFAADFPDSAGQALRALYSIEARAVSQLDRSSTASLEEHLKLFPKGSTAGEVRQLLAELRDREEERRQWEALKLAPTKAGIEQFVTRYPLGAHAGEARRLLEPVVQAERRAARWALIREQGYSDQLKAFIAEFGTGPEVDEARVRLTARLRQKEDEAWTKAKDARDPIPLLKLLRDYPDGARRAEVIATLAALPGRIEREAQALLEGSHDPELLRACGKLFPGGAFRQGEAAPSHAAKAVPLLTDTASAASAATTGRYRAGYGIVAAVCLALAIGSIAFSIYGAMTGIPVEGMTITLAGGFLFALLAATASHTAFRAGLPPAVSLTRHTALLIFFLGGTLMGGQSLTSSTITSAGGLPYDLVASHMYIAALMVSGWATVLSLISLLRRPIFSLVFLGVTVGVAALSGTAAGLEAAREYSQYWFNAAFAFGAAAVFVFAFFPLLIRLTRWLRARHSHGAGHAPPVETGLSFAVTALSSTGSPESPPAPR